MAKKQPKTKTLADIIDERLGIKRPNIKFDLNKPLTFTIGKLPSELTKMFKNGQLN